MAHWLTRECGRGRRGRRREEHNAEGECDRRGRRRGEEHNYAEGEENVKRQAPGGEDFDEREDVSRLQPQMPLYALVPFVTVLRASPPSPPTVTPTGGGRGGSRYICHRPPANPKPTAGHAIQAALHGSLVCKFLGLQSLD